MKVSVIGAGSWGTTIATMLATECKTILWSRRVDVAEAINGGSNPDYLPGFELPPELVATTSIERAIGRSDVVVMGVPSHGYRMVLEQAAPLLAPETPILSLTKGIEQRVRAINAFLHDIYHRQEILRAGRVPVDLIARNDAFLPQMIGVAPLVPPKVLVSTTSTPTEA